jgi:hypothetical protein
MPSLKNLKYATYIIIFLSACLHIYHVFRAFISTEGISKFSLGVMAWSIVSYIICLIILNSFGIPVKALIAGLFILIMDIWVHVDVFLSPSGSTAAVGLLFIPLWNMVLIIPIGCFLGWLIEKYYEFEKTKQS